MKTYFQERYKADNYINAKKTNAWAWGTANDYIRKGEIVDWPKILQDMEAEDRPSKLDEFAQCASCSWVTCACGNQCATLPRLTCGMPTDYDLYELGSQFAHDIHQVTESSGKEHRKLMLSYARDTLAKIEARSATLLKEQNV